MGALINLVGANVHTQITQVLGYLTGV